MCATPHMVLYIVCSHYLFRKMEETSSSTWLVLFGLACNSEVIYLKLGRSEQFVDMVLN